MGGTQPLSDPDGSKRAALAASLEYGSHPVLGQHLYRNPLATPELATTVPTSDLPVDLAEAFAAAEKAS